jgi:hypothetical protein
MDIKETFIALTTRTYPHGTESELYHLLPSNLNTDEFGNLYIEIGSSPSTMFTSHLDTATKALCQVNHLIKDGIIKTDGLSILGADDKAGVTIMLYMIEHNIPGLYYFFLGEEVGCIGSTKLADKHKTEPLPNIKKVISFDRRDYDSVITFQSSKRCCSDTFGKALANELNKNESLFKYDLDPTGIYTDSAKFVTIYQECTNISVGYKNEHTFKEQQDINHLILLANAVIKIDWEQLPIERDQKVVEYSKVDNYCYGGWDWEYPVYDKPKVTKSKKDWFVDKKYDYLSNVSFDKNGILVAVDLHANRISEESEILSQFIMSIDLEYKSLEWDGFTLVVEYPVESGGHMSSCDRNELSEYLPELNFWEKYLKDDSITDDDLFLDFEFLD